MAIKQLQNLRALFNGGKAVFIIPLLASVFYAVVMPVSYDEAWTFIHFTHKGFATAVTHYPAPNNHITHSIITNITKYIPWLSDLLKLRISSIAANFISMVVLYRFVSKHFSQKMALAVVAVSSMLFMNVYYSYMSRGYALYNLFFIGALFAAFNIIKGIKINRNWVVFSIFCILGFYTVPTFIYGFIILNVLILFFLKRISRAHIISGCCVILIVYLLYLPIILHDGMYALTRISHERAMTFYKAVKSMPGFYLDVFRQISGIHWILLLTLIAFSFFRLFKNKNKTDWYFAVIMLVTPAILLSMHHLVPHVRVFNYYSAVFILIILLPYKDYIGRMPIKILLPVLVLVQLALLINADREVYKYEEKDLAINITADKIIPKIIGDKNYFSDGVILCTNLEYHLITKGYKNYKITDCTPFLLNADTLSGYDYVFIRKDVDKTLKHPVFERTFYYNIYKMNGK